MGHLPIEHGSVPTLRSLPAHYRVYTHINNADPIFTPGIATRALQENAVKAMKFKCDVLWTIRSSVRRSS